MTKNVLHRLCIALTVMAACAGSASAQQLTALSAISSVGSSEHETAFGDLAADAIRDSAGADIAFVPSSAIRPITIASGGMTADEISAAIVVTDSPSDTFVTSRLTGQQILDALERSVSRLPASFGGFLQISGLKVVFDPSKPEGSRIISAVLNSGSSIGAATPYTVAMTRELSSGDLGYFQVWSADNVIRTAPDSFASVVKTYAISHQPLDIHVDGRLKPL